MRSKEDNSIPDPAAHIAEQQDRITELEARLRVCESSEEISIGFSDLLHEGIKIRDAKIEQLVKALDAALESMASTLWKLEHFHEFETSERNAFIENTPIHLRANIAAIESAKR